MASLLETVTAYLGTEHSRLPAEIESAFAAEKDAQSRVCLVPDPATVPEEDWPPALVEALCRRVARNLELRAVPLGVKPSTTEMGVANMRVGGDDVDVRRLEAPFRPVVFG